MTHLESKAKQVERQSGGTQYIYAVINGVVEMIRK